MRSSAAYISKLKAEALGRTFKVQDTNHRLSTSTLYRGAAGCNAVDYTQLEYVEPCLCDYLEYNSANFKGGIRPIPIPRILDGGVPNRLNNRFLEGGNPTTSGNKVLDGGKP
jgi:hypothetical protein